MDNRNPVVLIHGIGDTAKLFDSLRRYLQGHDYNVFSFDLKPNNGAAGLEKLGEQAAHFIESALGGERAFDLVGFSMGGLVARYYVQRLGGLRRVQRLVTISTPHEGTWTAYLRWNEGARQMRPRSRFLKELNADRSILGAIRCTSIWTPLDLMIVPAASSLFAEARTSQVGVLTHALMMRDRRVHRLVKAALEE